MGRKRNPLQTKRVTGEWLIPSMEAPSHAITDRAQLARLKEHLRQKMAEAAAREAQPS